MATKMTAEERKTAKQHFDEYDAGEREEGCACAACEKMRAWNRESRVRTVAGFSAFACNEQKGLTYREYMATQMMAALVQRGMMGGTFDPVAQCRQKTAAEAVALADALIAELCKE